ncbi:hypothetical protein C7H19_23800, partial [Aphanothece hegewaldii CCALA 016]
SQLLSYVSDRSDNNLVMIYVCRHALDSLIDQTPDFSGAEIKSVVEDAAINAFYEGKKISYEDLKNAITKTIPLALTKAEQIQSIRNWAATSARTASTITTNQKGSRQINMLQ